MPTTLYESTAIRQTADQLLKQARQVLGDVDQFYRDQGLDPERVRSVMAAFTTKDMQAEATAQFDHVWREIESEVEQQLALTGQTSSRPSQKGPTPRRSMV